MRGLALLAAMGLLSCTDDPEPETCATDSAQTWVISELTFARRDDQVVRGFDLDEHQTLPGDAQGCGHADLTSPDGVDGIDNNFSALIPVLESTEAVATESLVRQSIASGELLMLLTLDGIDSWRDDSCVTFALERGVGTPLVDSSGTLLDLQTFARDPSVATSSTEGSAWDGRIQAGSLSFNLPLDVLNAQLDFEITRGVFEVKRRYDGALTGVMGGVIPIEQIVEILERDDVNLDDFVPVVRAVADIEDEQGQCSGLSLAFNFVALPAFIAE